MLWLVATKGALTANLTVPLPRGFTIITYLCIINYNSFFDSAFCRACHRHSAALRKEV
nr:MAG TPA: Cytochrome P460 [Caudoviricetes sp.]